MRVGVLLAAVASSSVASAQAYDPLDAAGWPRGYTIKQLRHLPECGPEGLPHQPGATIHCRPRIDPGVVQWALAVDYTTGGVFGDVGTTGGAHGVGVEGSLALLRFFQLGGRYELLAIELAPDETAASHHFLGHLKLRLFTDEVIRQGWTLGAGYGVALRGGALGGSTALGRVSLAREVALDLQRPKTAMTAAIELAYERSLDEVPRLDIATASLRLGFETEIRPARNLGQPEPSPWRHATSLDVFLPGGGGMSLGFRANPYLSLETSVNFMAGVEQTDLDLFQDGMWALQTGPRIQAVSWPFSWIPAYLQLQGGAAWIARDGGELRPVQTAELGLRALCHLGFDAGLWIRTELDADDRLALLAGGIAFRVVIGTDRTAVGGRADTHCEPAPPARPAQLVLRGGTQPTTSPSSTSSSTTVTYTLGLPDVSLPTVQLPTITPPPPRVERIVAREGFVWIAGRWSWRDNTYVWIGGHWEAARADQIWIPGRWELRGTTYIWIEGHWQPR